MGRNHTAQTARNNDNGIISLKKATTLSQLQIVIVPISTPAYRVIRANGLRLTSFGEPQEQ
jgi:hypothetical protein